MPQKGPEFPKPKNPKNLTSLFFPDIMGREGEGGVRGAGRALLLRRRPSRS